MAKAWCSPGLIVLYPIPTAPDLHPMTYELTYLPEHEGQPWTFQVTTRQKTATGSMTVTKPTRDLTEFSKELILEWVALFEGQEEYRICALIMKCAKIEPVVAE